MTGQVIQGTPAAFVSELVSVLAAVLEVSGSIRPADQRSADGWLVTLQASDGAEGSLVEVSHTGYANLGLTHRRRLFLGDSGEDLRGEDALIGKTPQRFSIRFHFQPDVHVSLTGNGQTALLRLGDGAGWRFRSDTDSITLDDSVYFGSGAAPRRTNVLVISGQTDGDGETIVRWAFRREKRPGLPSS